ncbi:hypothetical protein [Microbacterium sp. E-13]|uniref:hypothetical protein n=1 Tax=Microbacterium sp. E-13 TaxID=3404048 RepID=UPI003CF991F7
MSDELSSEDKEAVLRLVRHSTLTEIRFDELNARRYGITSDDIAPDKGQFEVGVQYRIDGEGFGYRINGVLKTQVGEARVSVAAEYSLDDYVPERRHVILFGNEVAIMAAFPYFREGFWTVTGRVFGEPINLPIAERGVFTFDVEAELAAALG